jgi:hypothetical protein
MRKLSLGSLVGFTLMSSSLEAKGGQTLNFLFGLSGGTSFFKNKDIDASRFKSNLTEKPDNHLKFSTISANVDGYLKGFPSWLEQKRLEIGLYTAINYKVWKGLLLGVNTSLEYAFQKERGAIEGLPEFNSEWTKLKNDIENTNASLKQAAISYLSDVAMPKLTLTPGFDFGYEFSLGPVSLTPLAGIQCGLQFVKDEAKGWMLNSDRFAKWMFSLGGRLSVFGFFSEIRLGIPLTETAVFDQYGRELNCTVKGTLGIEF